jgi:hypothetical protein
MVCMGKPSPARDRTAILSTDTASRRKRRSLSLGLDKDMTCPATHDGSPGSSAVCSEAGALLRQPTDVFGQPFLVQTTKRPLALRGSVLPQCAASPAGANSLGQMPKLVLSVDALAPASSYDYQSRPYRFSKSL